LKVRRRLQDCWLRDMTPGLEEQPGARFPDPLPSRLIPRELSCRQPSVRPSHPVTHPPPGAWKARFRGAIGVAAFELCWQRLRCEPVLAGVRRAAEASKEMQLPRLRRTRIPSRSKQRRRPGKREVRRASTPATRDAPTTFRLFLHGARAPSMAPWRHFQSLLSCGGNLTPERALLY